MQLAERPQLSSTERDRRWEVTRQFLVQHHLDAVIAFGEHEDAGAAAYTVDNWLTNDRPGSTVIFPAEGRPIVLAPFKNFFTDHADAMVKGEGTWIEARDMRAGRDAKALVRALEELNLTNSKIGVLGLEPSPPWHSEGIMPYNLWNDILSQLPDASFKSIGEEFIPLVLKLSDEEVEVLRYAADTGEKMAEAMVQATKVGASEKDIYAAGMSVALERGTIVPIMHLGSGPNAVIWGPPRWAWRAQPPRVLQAGDLVVSEIFCSYGMRQTQHQLTIAIGKVDDNIQRAADIARECYDAGLKALRPRARFNEVANAMLNPVKRAGGWVKGPQIHSLNPIAALCGWERMNLLEGQGYPEDSSLGTVLGNMVLEPGMSFAFEPSCGFGKQAVTIGGTVVVGSEGAIELNPFTARLHRLD